MPRSPKTRAELFYCEIPHGETMLVLLEGQEPKAEDQSCGRQHFHNLMEVGFCYQGSGKMVCAEGARPYAAGTVTMIPRNTSHAFVPDDPGLPERWEFFYFDAVQTLCRHEQEYTLLVRRVIRRLGTRAHLVTDAEQPGAAAMTRAILELMRRPASEIRWRESDHLLFSLLLEFADVVPNPEPDYRQDNTEITIVYRAMQYVEGHYQQPIRIGDLAGFCNLSETHYRRLFDQIVGMSPAEYINLVRVQKACELMKYGDDSMEAVAKKTGFSSQASFNRNFVKLVGVPPYRWKSRDRRLFSGDNAPEPLLPGQPAAPRKRKLRVMAGD